MALAQPILALEPKIGPATEAGPDSPPEPVGQDSPRASKDVTELEGFYTGGTLSPSGSTLGYKNHHVAVHLVGDTLTVLVTCIMKSPARVPVLPTCAAKTHSSSVGGRCNAEPFQSCPEPRARQLIRGPSHAPEMLPTCTTALSHTRGGTVSREPKRTDF